MQGGCGFSFPSSSLRPIFVQKSRRDGCIGPELQRALVWWRDVLELDLAELRPWQMPSEQPVHLFCDAAGSPAHLGAVVFVDGKCFWTHKAGPEELWEFFVARADQQINGLELLAISLGLSAF